MTTPTKCEFCSLLHTNPCTADTRQNCAIYQAQQHVHPQIKDAIAKMNEQTNADAALQALQSAVQPAPVAAAPAAPLPPQAAPVAVQAPTDGLEGATKFDDGKVMWHLLPGEATEEVLKVLAFGAKKYGEWNWTQGFKWSRTFSATLRHLWAWWRGEDNDPETKLSHLAHAATNIMFMLSYVLWKRGTDDRANAIGAGKAA